MLYLALNVHKLHAILIYEDSTVNNKSQHLKKKNHPQTVLYYKNRKAQVQQLIFFPLFGCLWKCEICRRNGSNMWYSECWKNYWNSSQRI